MYNISVIGGIVNKFLFGFWGLTIFDMMFFLNSPKLNVLDFLNSDVKQIFAILGLIYFTVQIPFKIIHFNHKRQMDKLLRIKLKKEIDLLRNEKDK
jgi:hypothetical protein